MSQGQVDGQAGAQRLLAALRWSTGMCLEAVWETIGAGTSDSPGSYQSAKDWWDRCPADRKRLGDRNPPAGALLRFSHGNSDGHICYSLGGESVASTDKPSSGLTGRSTITAIENSWGGRKYEGWTDWLGGWDVVNLGYPTVPPIQQITKVGSVFTVVHPYAGGNWVALITPAANGKLHATILFGGDTSVGMPQQTLGAQAWPGFKAQLDNDPATLPD